MCLGASFQPIIWCFRAGGGKDQHDWFTQAIATDRAPFSNVFCSAIGCNQRPYTSPGALFPVCRLTNCPGRSFQYVVASRSRQVNIQRRDNVHYALKDWSSDNSTVTWNIFDCSHATDIDAQRGCFLYSLPQTLLLQANRFTRSGLNGRLHKDSKHFYVPLQLTGESFSTCLPLVLSRWIVSMT